jgi:hypothetical protein
MKSAYQILHDHREDMQSHLNRIKQEQAMINKAVKDSEEEIAAITEAMDKVRWTPGNEAKRG